MKFESFRFLGGGDGWSKSVRNTRGYLWIDFHGFVESKNREKIKLELEVF